MEKPFSTSAFFGCADILAKLLLQLKTAGRGTSKDILALVSTGRAYLQSEKVWLGKLPKTSRGGELLKSCTTYYFWTFDPK